MGLVGVFIMEIISCKKAKEIGLKYYFTGKPYHEGHLSIKFVSNYGCKECLKSHCKKYYENNKQMFKEKNVKWHKINAEKHRNISKKWSSNNKEWCSKYGSKYKKINKSKITHYNVQRERKKKYSGIVKYEEWNKLKEKYNYTCLCCKKKEPEIKLSQDHVVPLSNGGLNIIDNIQPLCLSCNCKKHKSTIDYRPI